MTRHGVREQGGAVTTRETIEGYFAALRAGNGWEEYLSDGMVFTSYTTPNRQVTGRDAYVASTKGFYRMIDAMEVRELIVEGDTACALTHYRLQPPAGDPFTSDVAEILTVTRGQIDRFSILFDTAPYPI
jgi:ketosteroid isomerase-like protein